MNQEQTISLTLDTTSSPLGACAKCSSTKFSVASQERIADIDGLQFAAGIPVLRCLQCGETYLDNVAIQRFNVLMIEELERLGIHPACADWVIGAKARMLAEAARNKPQSENTEDWIRRPVEMFSRFKDLDKELASGVAAKPQPKKCKACGLRRVKPTWKPEGMRVPTCSACGAEREPGGGHGSR